MEFFSHFLLVLVLLFLAQVHADGNLKTLSPSYGIHKLNRSSFPPGFLFGASSAAYQIEGAWNIDGKGPSVWDNFTHKFPERIKDHSNGDVATDSYHLYEEDVRLLKEMNMNSYRFSISWPRVLPSGKLSEGVNEKGIEYYNNLINHLLDNGITPMVTLFHWDLPQALEDEYGGFLSPQIVNDFHDFANLCFERFGDRVKNWITMNEPTGYSYAGYAIGFLPPNRCSSWMNNCHAPNPRDTATRLETDSKRAKPPGYYNNNCSGGDSGTEPYIVSHHLLLAHAKVAKLYKTKFQAHQKGVIGITLVSVWVEPYSNSLDDRRAVNRFLEFNLEWFMDPLFFGDYPKSMRTLVGHRLPNFTKEQSEQVKGSYDFIGMNYYTAYYVIDQSHTIGVENKSLVTDLQAQTTASRNGTLIGEEYGSGIVYFYPRGIQKLLLYIKRKYKNPIIYITENGVNDIHNSSMKFEALNDSFRIKYHHAHLSFLHKAILDGVQVRGYHAWSLVDDFEWTAGFTSHFGLNFVDFSDGLKRYPKLSAKWFQRFLTKY